MRDYSQEIKKHSKSKIPFIVLLCAAVYTVSYLSRLSLSSVVAEAVSCGDFTKSALAVPLTAISVTYGIGQLVSGFLGDRISPEKMIFTGLGVSAVMNLCIPFSSSTLLMTVIWAINGFAQAMMWPPIVKILTTRLSIAQYQKHVVIIGYASSVGTIIIYLCAPIAIKLAGWRSVFFFAAGITVIMAIAWQILGKKPHSGEIAKSETATNNNTPAEHMPKWVIGLLALIVAAVALQGIIRDGISTWMPTYITEVFKVDSTVSILTGVALPMFTIFVTRFAVYLYLKRIKNESLCAAIFFATSAISCGILSITASFGGAVLAVTLLMLTNSASHGVNSMFTSMVIPNFVRYGKTSFISGLINSATYLGSAISIFGVAIVTENFGWTATLILWTAASLAGAIVSFIAVKRLKRLKKLNSEQPVCA